MVLQQRRGRTLEQQNSLKLQESFLSTWISPSAQRDSDTRRQRETETHTVPAESFLSTWTPRTVAPSWSGSSHIDAASALSLPSSPPHPHPHPPLARFL